MNEFTQDFTIEDVNPLEETIYPSLAKCFGCGKMITICGEGDNFLGRNPYECKHWCYRCFENVKAWMIHKKYFREVKSKKESKKTSEETQAKLNF